LNLKQIAVDHFHEASQKFFNNSLSDWDNCTIITLVLIPYHCTCLNFYSSLTFHLTFYIVWKSAWSYKSLDIICDQWYGFNFTETFLLVISKICFSFLHKCRHSFFSVIL
jgi:hypothetical protein